MSISDEKRSKTEVLRPRNIPGETRDMSEPEKKREEIYIYCTTELDEGRT